MNESLIPLEGVQGCVGFLFLAYQVLSRLDVENKVSRYRIRAAPFADPWDHSSRLVHLSRRLMCLLCQRLPWEAGVLCSIWNDKQFRCPTAQGSACLGRWREAGGGVVLWCPMAPVPLTAYLGTLSCEARDSPELGTRWKRPGRSSPSLGQSTTGP